MKYNTPCRWAALFLFSIWYCSLAAQIVPGYCITATGDSIPGTVDVQKASYISVNFKAADSQKSERFQPEDVKKIVLTTGAMYLTHNIVFHGDTQAVFLHSLVTGTYNLYQTSTQEEGVLYYVNSVNNPQLIKVNYRALETQFKTYFGSCAPSFKGKLRYTETSLVSYAQRMNMCADSTSVPKGLHLTKLNMHLGIGLSTFGYQYKGLIYGFSERHRVRFPAQNKAGLGLLTQVEIGKALNIQIGANYVRMPFQSDTVQTGQFVAGEFKLVTYNSREDFNLQYLEFPFGLSVNPFPHAKINPVFGGGGMFVRAIVSKGTDQWFNRIYLPPAAGDPNAPAAVISRTRNNFTGFYLMAGLSHTLKNSHVIEVSVRYIGTKRNNKIVTREGQYYPYPLTVKADRFQINLSYTLFSKH